MKNNNCMIENSVRKDGKRRSSKDAILPQEKK
jgi:hypothetical protein